MGHQGSFGYKSQNTFHRKGALQASCFHGVDKTEQERAFEELRSETFAQRAGVEKSEVHLGEYEWAAKKAPEEERAKAYSSEQNQQFYNYALSPDLYQLTPGLVTASPASGKREIS